MDDEARKRAFENFTPRANPQQVALPTADDDTDITDPDELRKFTRQELIRVVKRNRGSLGVVPALRELMDRLDGKPAGAAPQINIGTGSGEKQIRVVFVTPEDVRRDRETKLIEG